jgi:hypothetical protein
MRGDLERGQPNSQFFFSVSPVRRSDSRSVKEVYSRLLMAASFEKTFKPVRKAISIQLFLLMKATGGLREAAELFFIPAMPVRTWNFQDSGTNIELLDLFFYDNLIGWAVGYHGIVLSTVDGGESWITQDSGITGNLTSVHFINTQTGWTVGEGGLVLKTMTVARPGIMLKGLCSIVVISMYGGCRQGMVAGVNGTILTTSDGGENWVSQNSGTDYIIKSISFLNSRQGFAVGNWGMVLKRQMAAKNGSH